MNWTYYIYGLYVSGKCVYVGCTVDMKKRVMAHRCAKRFKGLGHKLSIRAFRTAKESDQPARIDQQIIRAMQRKGIPILNRTIDQTVKVMETGRVFYNMAECARFYDCPAADVVSAVRRRRDRGRVRFGNLNITVAPLS